MSTTTVRARSRALGIAGVLALSLALAACGSNLSPQSVNEAQGSGPVAGQPADGAAPVAGADGTVAAGTTPDTPVEGLPADGAPAAGEPGPAGGGAAGPTEPDGEDPGVPAEEGGGGGAAEAGDCAGFTNQTGITDDKIVIGNSSDISGPVPGLFATAQDATKAFVAYFNAQYPSGICGRRLELKLYDSRTDAGADQQAYAAACDEVFAMVGSVSAFDLGGAATAEDCGIPDLRGGAVTIERNACSVCFGVQAVNGNYFENAVPDFVVKQYGDAAKHAAYFYSDAGAAKQNAGRQVKAMERRGMSFDVVQGIATSEFNYVPYVQQMKDNDIEVVFFTTAYDFSVKMRQAMQQQGFTPKLYLRDPTDYNPEYVARGGDAVEGTVVYTNFAPFEEANKESDLYEAYLGQVNPSADPLFFGAFAWSAGRLFTDLAMKLGGKLTRSSLVAEVRKTEDWTGHGLHAPQPVGSKGTGECWRFIQLTGGTWRPLGSRDYSCTGITSTN